jgi:hypothetical protein
MVSKWFAEKNLAMALGMTISLSRLGSVASGWLLPYLYLQHFLSDNYLFLPLLCCACFNLFSWFCGVGLALLDKHADKKDS